MNILNMAINIWTPNHHTRLWVQLASDKSHVNLSDAVPFVQFSHRYNLMLENLDLSFVFRRIDDAYMILYDSSVFM